MTSYKIFDQLRRILPATGPSGHGIRMRIANFFFDKPIESNQEEYEKMLEIEEAKVCPSMHQTRGHLADLLLRRSLASSATHCL